MTKNQDSKVRHTGLNAVMLITGVLVLGFVFLLKYYDSDQIEIPLAIVSPLRALLLVFGTLFAATILLRFTVDRVGKIFGDYVELEQKILLGKLYGAIIYIIAFAFIMWRLGFSAQNLTIFLGLATTGLAFAIRDIIISYLAWLILLTKRPFRIGDFIKIGDDEGKVIHIGTFHVLIDNTPDQKEDYIRIPNRIFLEKPVQNFGPRNPFFTIKTNIEMIPDNYGELISKIKEDIKSSLDVDAAIYLDSNHEKIYLRSEFRTDYGKKKKVQDFIVFSAAKYFRENIKNRA